MTTTVSITQDLTVPVRQVIYSKVGDTSRYVEVTLFNDGVAWEVPSGATLSLEAVDELGTTFSSSSVTATGNAVTALLPTFVNRGVATVDILIESDGALIAGIPLFAETFKSA